MSGLLALLDDVAALAKLAAASLDDVAGGAAKASAKAAGVVVDDAAVTPQYVAGARPARELPMIRRIAKGSLVNKAIILVALLILSSLVPWILTPLLMLGGTYLCFEGAEKIWHWIRSRRGHGHDDAAPAAEKAQQSEDQVVRGAITTDFILSCEIMVISMNEVAHEGLVTQALILIVVGLAITLGVYGVVGLIVKMDDIGLHIAERSTGMMNRLGHGIVRAMPIVMRVITIVGTAAMLWVGGHIVLVGAADLSFTAPYDLVHHLEEPVTHVAAVGPFLGWLVNTLCSALLGFVWGSVIVGVVHLLPFGRKEHAASH